MWAHKEGRQPEHEAIEHGEIRRTLSGAIADQELMFEQERFSCDLARSARAEEFREGHEQMDRQEEHIAHELVGNYLAGQSAQDCTTAAIHAKFANSPPTAFAHRSNFLTKRGHPAPDACAARPFRTLHCARPEAGEAA
jgi:hypothetical protein